MTTKELWDYWDKLVECGIATTEELELVTYINGLNEKTLNDVLYVRTGLRDYEQLKGELNENQD